MKMFKIKTMGETTLIPAKTLDDAYAKFFIEVKTGRYPMDKVGGLIMVTDPDDGEEYGFRTTPTLWLMELISAETAFATIEKMLDLDPFTDDSANLLLQTARTDGWILDQIKQLEAGA